MHFLRFKTNHHIPCTLEFAPKSLCLCALLHCVCLAHQIVYSAYTTGLIQLNSNMTPHFRSSKETVRCLCEPVVGFFCTGPQFCALLVGVSVFFVRQVHVLPYMWVVPGGYRSCTCVVCIAWRSRIPPPKTRLFKLDI